MVFPTNGEARDYETVGTTTTAIGCTASKLVDDDTEGLKGLPCRAILVTIETASLNICFDGTTPTTVASTNNGHTLIANQSILITGWENVRNFLCINAVASSGAVAKITYYY